MSGSKERMGYFPKGPASLYYEHVIEGIVTTLVSAAALQGVDKVFAFLCPFPNVNPDFHAWSFAHIVMTWMCLTLTVLPLATGWNRRALGVSPNFIRKSRKHNSSKEQENNQ